MDSVSAAPLDSTSPPHETTAESLKELTASVKDLITLFTPDHQEKEHAPKTRSQINAERDEMVKAIVEQRDKPIKKLPDWEKIELMSPDAIEQETREYHQKYEDFWKTMEGSTPTQIQTTEKAYASAFRRFDTIYHTLGWREDEVDNDTMFNEANLSAHRNLLLNAIFSLEAYRAKRFFSVREPSRAVFEYSRLPRLLAILVRIESRQRTIIACGRDKTAITDRPFDPDTVLRVLIEVAQQTDSIQSDGVNRQMTFEKLLSRCYSRRVLTQPDADDIDAYLSQCQLIYDCLGAIDFSRPFREIRDPLSVRFFVKHRSEPVSRVWEMIQEHHALTRGIERFKLLPLEESLSATFDSDQFNVQYLQDFGGLRVEWTDCLDEHLKIYTGRNVIRIFEHPTFFYNQWDLHKNERDYIEPTYFELGLTYALLFRPSSRSGLKRLRKYTEADAPENALAPKHVTFLGEPIQHAENPFRKRKPLLFTEQLDIDPKSSPAKDVLASLYRCSLPPAVQAAFDIAEPSSSIRGFGSYCRHKITSTSMRRIGDLAPHYPEDVRFMITSVFENDLQDMEAFVRFAYFGPRLKQLKTYLDSRRPQTWRELWADRRDIRGWWIFWGLMSLLGLVSLLALLWVVVQVVALVLVYTWVGGGLG